MAWWLDSRGAGGVVDSFVGGERGVTSSSPSTTSFIPPNTGVALRDPSLKPSLLRGGFVEAEVDSSSLLSSPPPFAVVVRSLDETIVTRLSLFLGWDEEGPLSAASSCREHALPMTELFCYWLYFSFYYF